MIVPPLRAPPVKHTARTPKGCPTGTIPLMAWVPTGGGKSYTGFAGCVERCQTELPWYTQSGGTCTYNHATASDYTMLAAGCKAGHWRMFHGRKTASGAKVGAESCEQWRRAACRFGEHGPFYGGQGRHECIVYDPWCVNTGGVSCRAGYYLRWDGKRWYCESDYAKCPTGIQCTPRGAACALPHGVTTTTPPPAGRALHAERPVAKPEPVAPTAPSGTKAETPLWPKVAAAAFVGTAVLMLWRATAR